MGTMTETFAGAELLKTLERRYACKKFDSTRPVDPHVLEYIAECGRLAPTSFGLEGWKFVVAVSEKTRTSLAQACFDQDPVATSPAVCVILARKAEAFAPESDFLRQRSGRFPGGYDIFLPDYRGYYEFLVREDRLEDWSRSQTYLACASMMIGASAAGLDSCPIEGFEEKSVLEAVEGDPAVWMVGIVLALGFRAEDRRPKIREPLKALLEFR